ncbi:MAG: effector binding domain-containing protein [Clostridia bacterium]|nr:effector binding domain-containing protein [Clostridia bacterium]
MNWIQGIQNAINYVESNITEDIDFEDVSKQAYSSSFHFQRVFSILCGFSLGDYIRMRRLSLAGEELSKGNAKIVDIAMKYGYDTPEGFSRAFTRFHGIAPNEAKHGGKVKIFTPLSVKLSLTGGSKMDYRIEKREAFKVVCKRRRVGKPQSANATTDITALWQEYGADGTLERLIACIPKKPVMKGLLGICFSAELNAKQFPYGIGVEYDGRKIDDDLEVVTIPESTYAVFTSKGKMPDAFIETYHRIVTEFFPQSTQYEYAENVEFEVYSSADTSNPDYQCEIWIAVNEKNK